MENGKFHKFSFRKHKKKPTSKKKTNKRNRKKNDDYTSRDKEKMLGRDER